jgi:hypothetical protein
MKEKILAYYTKDGQHFIITETAKWLIPDPNLYEELIQGEYLDVLFGKQ